MRNPLEDPAVEHATRVFLAGMGRMNARRTPDRPARVPSFDSLNAPDRAMMLTVIGTVIDAAQRFRAEQASASPTKTARDTESIPSELTS